MAHELEIVDGVAQIAYAGEKPWHGLGVEIGNDLTPAEIMKAAGLNWTVSKVPLFAEVGSKKIKTGAEALIRDKDSKVLSIVTDNWNPCQNKEAFEFFTDFVSTGDMQMHTAGSLKGGSHVWALAKINDQFELFGGDKVEGYLLFSNPHQFGKCITVQFTPIRVVCNNTLTLSLSETSGRMVRVNHRREFDADMVKETLGVASHKLAKYKAMAELLGKKRYKQLDLVNYFNKVFPKTSDKKDEVANENQPHSRAAKLAMAVVDTQPGAEFAPGSWWSAYNAVTYLTDHELGRSVDTRLTSAWFGVNQTKKVKALNLAVDMANAA